MTPYRGALLAVAVFTAIPGRAGAIDEEAAVRHFQTATALFEAEDYELALAEFQAAYDAKPHPTVLRNVAATLERLRRYPEAIAVLERFLREASGAVFRNERAAIAQHLTGLRSLVGRIEIVLERPGFTIEIDGREVGTSPLAEPVEVAIGVRRVVGRLEGWEPAVESVRVEAGATSRVALRPVARMGRLTIDAAAAHARVSVDGAEARTVPWSGAVMPGSHDVRVTAPGRRTSRLSVTVAPGAERSLVVQLESGGPQGLLWIDLRQAPIGTRASVDGIPIELGRDAARAIDQGTHRVVVEAPDRVPYEGNVRVRANRASRVRVRLDEDRFFVTPIWPTIAGIGTALAVAGVVYWGAQATAAANEYEDPDTARQDLAGAFGDRERFARAADSALLTTAILGAATVALYLLSRREPHSTARVEWGPIE